MSAGKTKAALEAPRNIMSDPLDGLVVVLRRRSYCDQPASVHPLRHVSPDRVGFGAASFFGTVAECEAHALKVGASVGTVAEPMKAFTLGDAHEIMFKFERRLHEMVANR